MLSRKLKYIWYRLTCVLDKETGEIRKRWKEDLHKILDKPRRRPLMGPFHGPNGDYYIRNQSLSYWQLVKKLGMEKQVLRRLRYHHFFQKAHHLAKNPDDEYIEGYITAGFLIACFAFITIFYLYMFFKYC